MKRLLAMLIALAILAVPALCEPMSFFDYTDDILEDGSPIYYFPELSLRLPADWQGKVIAMAGDGGTSFYQRASYEKYREEGIGEGGFLFRLGASVNGSFSQLPAFEYLGFSEDSAMNYYLELPTDYPAYNDDAIRAEYDAMFAQIDFVVANASFYSDQSASGSSGDAPLPDLPEDGAGGTFPDAAEAAGENSAGENAAWTPAQVRYQFEHSVLPRYFYEVPENMLNAVADPGLYTLWASYATENGVDPTYPAGDCVARWYAAGDGTTVAQVELPEPDATTLCFRVYFIYNAAGDRGYYTVESEEMAPDIGFICRWNEDRTHEMLGVTPVLDRTAGDHEGALASEAQQVAALAGIGDVLSPAEPPAFDLSAPDAEPAPDAAPLPEDTGAENLAVIECPQQGFSTMADPAYAWNYEDGTGITIFTEAEGRIPYVIVYRAEDLVGEPFEFLKEQYTPHIQQQYGDDLVSFEEVEAWDIGGKTVPAGLYTYRLQGHLVDLVRIYDSTGDRTVTYTAKYIQGQGDATLAALDVAIRNFKAE